MRVYLIAGSTVYHGIHDMMDRENCNMPLAPMDGQALVEFAGRTCYRSYDNPAGRTYDEYTENLMRQGHGSVFEHVSYTFAIFGVSRTLTHELVRHRAGWAYSQVSQRYCDSSADPVIVGNAAPEYVRAHIAASKAVYSMYFDYLRAGGLDRKAARGLARAVLPQGVATDIVATANVRALRHFFEMRGAEGADAEIRALACSMLDLVRPMFPAAFADMETRDGKIFSVYRKI